MAKALEKSKAREMRTQGRSIKEIAKILQVSPGTVSIWCADITLTQAQNAILAKRMSDPHYGLRAKYLEKVKEKTKEKINKLRLEGLNEVGTLTNREFFVAGIALYWAEGFKKDKQIGFANLDPRMINFFIAWLTQCLHISRLDIRARVVVNQTYIDNIREIEEYWAETINIPISNFQKATIQQTTWKKDYENKDQYKGILRIRVAKSLPQLRKIFGYIDGLTEHAKNI